MKNQLPIVLCTIGDDSDVVFGSMLVPDERVPTLFSMPGILIDVSCASAELQLRTMEATSADAFCMFFSPELSALKQWKLQERGIKRGARRGVQVLR
jgi:hypothetical protein